uniref:Halomucin n=1 Tax=Magallana gigas TaxID=29159 RepID=K1QIJ7_MAGGI
MFESPHNQYLKSTIRVARLGPLKFVASCSSLLNHQISRRQEYLNARGGDHRLSRTQLGLANVCLRQFLDTMLGMTVMYVFFHNNLSDQLAADIITWAYLRLIVLTAHQAIHTIVQTIDTFPLFSVVMWCLNFRQMTGNAAASVESVTYKNCNEVIELDDSIEDKEIEKNNCDLSVQSNDLKDKCNQKKSEDELLEISSDSDNEVKQKLQKEERMENDMKQEEEDKLLASDEDDTRQSGVSTASHHSQETIAKCEDSQESMNKCEDSQESIGKFEDSGESISKFEDSPESTSKFEDSGESTSKCEDSRESTSKCEDSQDSADCEKGSDSNNGKDNESASEKMEVDEEEEESDSESVKNEDSDSKSSEDSKKSDSGDKKVEKGINEKKRPANFEDALAFGPKRTRLDMVIGKLGSQIGIAPESLKDEEMSDTDTATESTPTPTEDTEDEDEENSLQRKKKKPPVRLSEKRNVRYDIFPNFIQMSLFFPNGKAQALVFGT